MHLFWKPSYNLIQSFLYDQVLTGVLPYYGRNQKNMITDIRDGRRPYRPIDASQLQDPIWDVITTGWSHEPEKRCELSVMRDTIVTSSQQGSGNLNNRNDRNLTISNTETERRQRGKILPRIASFFQFLQNSQSDVQRQVDEINEVSFTTSPCLNKADTSCSIWRTTLRWTRSD